MSGSSFTPSGCVVPRALHISVSPSMEFEPSSDSGHHTLYFYCDSSLKGSFWQIWQVLQLPCAIGDHHPILQMNK